MSYDLSKHRPHADAAGTPPESFWGVGPDNINVTLDNWGPTGPSVFSNVLRQDDATWGFDAPKYPKFDGALSLEEMKRLEKIFQGNGLPQVLEQFTFCFCVEGVSLNCTHQLVRTRIGASFLQQSMRTNDARKMGFNLPEVVHQGLAGKPDAQFDVEKFVAKYEEYCDDLNIRSLQSPDETAQDKAHSILACTLRMQKAAYAAMVEAGVPFQDARRWLASGHTTYLWCNYNLVALRSVLAHRLENIAVDWEIDCVAQLMMREVYIKCPKLISHSLGSGSDKAGKSLVDGIVDWPLSGKWPSQRKQVEGEIFTRAQCPYYVLRPSSLVPGSQVAWFKTDGTFPWDQWLPEAEMFVPDHPWIKKYKEAYRNG